MNAGHPSVALVHDYLLVMRGAERTFSAITSCWPQAPIFTLLYDASGTMGSFADRNVHTSYLQRLGVRQVGFRRLLPLFPAATRSLPVGDFDLVISSSSAFAHGVRAGSSSTHLCYCHTPFRYAWHERERALEEVPRVLRRPADAMLEGFRRWDVAASRRVSGYIANSALVKRRIADCYGRTAAVLHPPVEVDRFHVGAAEDYFLLVGEAVGHKRFDLALEAARRARRPVKVVGDGPELKRLTGEYGSTAEFLGRVGDEELADLYAACRALIVPNVEEFGITAVEAQASGRPVVAAAAGGACETVIDGETGVLVEPDSLDSLTAALDRVEFDAFSQSRLVRHARTFSTAAFKHRLVSAVKTLAAEASPGAPEPRSAFIDE